MLKMKQWGRKKRKSFLLKKSSLQRNTKIRIGSGETQSKRSKTNDTTVSSLHTHNETAFLESEIEELIKGLKKERESHGEL